MASSTTTKESSPFSSSPRYIFDVFLSFRGVDTRNNITNLLYEALRRQGIIVFRDDDELERGKAIANTLTNSIRQSRCTIVILSKRYADSKWCLRELVEIVKCKNSFNQIVLVVFYKIKPSDVNSPTGIFEKFFVDFENDVKENFEEVQDWRNAMEVVGGLTPWVVNEQYDSLLPFSHRRHYSV